MSAGEPRDDRRRLPTSWVVAAFVVLVLVVATILIVTRFDGEDDVPEETDVGAPMLAQRSG
ncbi:hypothetical protein [Nocardioides ferulae]|uniref:hypothetical protein n=1 Tax=Nocardioides ferulae TaxID=2340821 RepID=UPI000EAEEA0B|nr:hypothetical protein [Nocardioides ferulae]